MNTPPSPSLTSPDAVEAPPSPEEEAPPNASTIAPIAIKPIAQPAKKPMLFQCARREISIRITALTGNGLIATATARGKISPIV